MSGTEGLAALTAPVRAFVALPCPDGWRRGIAEGLDPWRDQFDGVAWTDPRRIHLTLRFLGHAEPEALRRLDAGLLEVARATRPVEARVGATGAFPGWSRPRVLWLGVESGGAVERLAAAVESEARAAGFEAEGRPFSPHLTLGRVRGARGVRHVVETLRGWELDLSPSRLGEIVLYRSRLDPGGARHDPLSTHRLEQRDD